MRACLKRGPGHCEDVLGASPAQGDPRTAMAIVVQHPSAARTGERLLDPHRRSDRSQFDHMLEDLGIDQPGLELLLKADPDLSSPA